MEGLLARGRGYRLGPATIPLVPGALLFALLNGGDKDWQENPYRVLGRAAYEAAGEDFEIGSTGAGTGALTAMVKGGLGSASFVLESGVTVGALVAANPMGAVTTPGEKHFWAAPFEVDGEFGGCGVDPAAGLGRQLDSRKMKAMQAQGRGQGQSAALPPEGGNTTIAIVATDADLTKAQCQRLAIAAHDGIGRATVPAHAPGDGDLVFALSTGACALGDADAALGGIGHAAALCLSRAIARAAYAAKPAAGDILPCFNAA
jgi:D-aminopeptidase